MVLAILFAELKAGYITFSFFLSRISSHQIVEVVEEVIRRKRGFLITTLTNGVNLRLYLITAIIGDFFLVYFFTFFSFVLYHLLFKF